MVFSGLLERFLTKDGGFDGEVMVVMSVDVLCV